METYKQVFFLKKKQKKTIAIIENWSQKSDCDKRNHRIATWGGETNNKEQLAWKLWILYYKDNNDCQRKKKQKKKRGVNENNAGVSLWKKSTDSSCL